MSLAQWKSGGRCVLCEVAHTTANILREDGTAKGGPMENNRAINQTEIESLYYEFPDETLEIAAADGEKAGRITLYICTALYFCPGP
jgi:hypothetical protein